MRYHIAVRVVASVTVLGLLVAAGLYAARHQTVDSLAPGKLSVVASFYPLQEFARQVGGDKVAVQVLTPNAVEPHDYDPSPRAIAQAQQARVLIYNGVGMEPWIGGLARGFDGYVVAADKAVQPTRRDGQLDPHIWLDPVRAQAIVRAIATALTKADADNAAYYAGRAAKYVQQLKDLDAAYRQGLATCGTRTLVASHDAFGYLADRYDLRVYALTGLSADREPSPAKLAELADVVRRQQLQYVFFESLVSPRAAATIAAEAGVKTLAFDPIEGVSNADQQAGKTYASIQRQNLANLRIALACD